MDRAGKLKRTLVAVAFAMVIEISLLWGIVSLTPPIVPLEIAPEALSIDIWPQWRLPDRTPPKTSKLKIRHALRSPEVVSPSDAASQIDPKERPPAEDLSMDRRPQNGLPQGLVNSLRGRQACQTAMGQGKPLPPNCPERGYAAIDLPVTPKDRAAYWDKIISAHEAQQAYRAAAGNSDYWRRVTGLRNYRDDVQRPGAYADPKAQWFFSPDIQPDSARVGK